MATNEELLARINTHPCTPGDVQKSITNITNVINNIAGQGSIEARCTLTCDNMDCAPELLDVSGFTPLVKDFSSLGIPVPTQARQYQGIATHDARVGYIVYNWDAEEWEVRSIEQALRINLVSPPELSGKTLTFHTDTQSVNECGLVGQEDVTFGTTSVTGLVRNLSKAAGSPIVWDTVDMEVWDASAGAGGSISTVVKSAIRNFFKLNCTIYANERELEVFASSDDPSDYGMVTFDEEVAMLYNLYIDGGYIWGDFLNITVPCTGLEFSLPLIPLTECSSSGGSG